MPVLFRCAVKPTPSIALPQDSVDAEGTRAETLVLGGRHDPAIVHRARVVVDSVTALRPHLRDTASVISDAAPRWAIFVQMRMVEIVRSK